MFPFRTSSAFKGLLELADAMLAPEQAATHREHPHRTPLASRRRRRLSPERAAQICISPVSRDARTPGRTSASDATTLASRPAAL